MAIKVIVVFKICLTILQYPYNSPILHTRMTFTIFYLKKKKKIKGPRRGKEEKRRITQKDDDKKNEY